MKNAPHIIALVFLLLSACGNDSRIVDPEPTPGSKTLKVPSQYLTIQAAIDSAKHGDSILVADGTYFGDGNRDIATLAKSLIIVSENGPLYTIIDCGGNMIESHAAFRFTDADDKTVIDGFTIINGTNNNGGAIYCFGASPTVRNCIFRNNISPVSGGAVWAKGSKAMPFFRNCTFVANGAPVGNAIYLSAGASPRIWNCIFAMNYGIPVERRDNTCKPQFYCTDIWNNDGGDWIEDIADQLNQDGNISTDPQFCGPLGYDFRLRPGSPCLPDSSACNIHIGAVAETCTPDPL